MIGVLLAAAAFAVSPLNSRAEETAVHLTVRPMAAPKPALLYQLLPEVRELNAGYAAHFYLKCFMEQQQFFYSEEAVAERARYHKARPTQRQTKNEVIRLNDHVGVHSGMQAFRLLWEQGQSAVVQGVGQ
jgi:hypothetical protein